MSFTTRELPAPTPMSSPSVAWEETGCPLCNSGRWLPFLEAPDNLTNGSGLWFAVVRCLDCGLCFTNPRPDVTSIGQFYPAGYWSERTPGLGARRAVWRWCRPWRERRILAGHGKCRLLDFGCGEGAFLDRMHRNGWNVTGVDASPVPVRRARAELGLPVLIGSLPHAQLRPGSFDVITMWHSLEHVHQPRQVLQEAHRLLVPGGKLMVAVPNIESLPFAWFGAAWYGLDLPRHLTHFSPLRLRWTLQRSGFRVSSIRMVRQNGWLRASARLLDQSTRSADKRLRLLQEKHVARVATWYTYLTNRCDCILAAAERV